MPFRRITSAFCTFNKVRRNWKIISRTISYVISFYIISSLEKILCRNYFTLSRLQITDIAHDIFVFNLKIYIHRVRRTTFGLLFFSPAPKRRLLLTVLPASLFSPSLFLSRRYRRALAFHLSSTRVTVASCYAEAKDSIRSPDQPAG